MATGTIKTPTKLVYIGDIQSQTTINITENGLYLFLMTANAANGSTNPYFNMLIDGTTVMEIRGTNGGNVTSFKVANLSAGSTVVINCQGYIYNYGYYGIDAIVAIKLL